MYKPIKAYIKTIEIIGEDEDILVTLEAFDVAFKTILKDSIYSPEELRGIADVLEKAERYANDFYKEYEDEQC